MKEKDIQTIFGKNNRVRGVFELKLCKAKRIPCSAVNPNQLKALKSAMGPTGLYHKISDFPVSWGGKTRFTHKKPFDCFYISDFPAYIVICFYVPRVRKTFYYINPWAWSGGVEEMEDEGRKSFTEENIERMSEHVYNF